MNKDNIIDNLDDNFELDIEGIRKLNELSTTQLAIVLGVSPSTIESWESGRRNPKQDLNQISLMVSAHSNCVRDPKKIIFDEYAVSYARSILGKSVVELAKMFGLKESSWRSIEHGRRRLPDEAKEKIEDMIRDKISELSTKAFPENNYGN